MLWIEQKGNIIIIYWRLMKIVASTDLFHFLKIRNEEEKRARINSLQAKRRMFKKKTTTKNLLICFSFSIINWVMYTAHMKYKVKHRQICWSRSEFQRTNCRQKLFFFPSSNKWINILSMKSACVIFNFHIEIDLNSVHLSWKSIEFPLNILNVKWRRMFSIAKHRRHKLNKLLISAISPFWIMTSIKRSFGFYFCSKYIYLTRLIIMRQHISFLFATCFNCRALFAAVIINYYYYSFNLLNDYYGPRLNCLLLGQLIISDLLSQW